MTLSTLLLISAINSYPADLGDLIALLLQLLFDHLILPSINGLFSFIFDYVLGDGGFDGARDLKMIILIIMAITVSLVFYSRRR